MVLLLDPRIPLVWRTPDTIQLGVDRPRVVAGVSASLERCLFALRCGVPRETLNVLGQDAGASVSEIDRLLRELGAAVLVTRRPPPVSPRPPVCVDGAGPTAARLRSLLEELEVAVLPPELPDEGHRAAEARYRSAGLAVIVGHYVVEPARHARWLRRDIAHLPVVFSDTEVRLGPLVEPGSGPCLLCLEHNHVDADAAWPGLATQLMRRTAPTETTRLSIVVAARVMEMVQDRLDGRSTEFATTSLVIDAATGALTRREHRPHARCGCRALSESATAPAEPASARRLPPSSETAAAGPG